MDYMKRWISKLCGVQFEDPIRDKSTRLCRNFLLQHRQSFVFLFSECPAHQSSTKLDRFTGFWMRQSMKTVTWATQVSCLFPLRLTLQTKPFHSLWGVTDDDSSVLLTVNSEGLKPISRLQVSSFCFCQPMQKNHERITSWIHGQYSSSVMPQPPYFLCCEDEETS